MGTAKALLIGVCNYNINIADNLPLCENDIDLMNKSIIDGLKLKKSDIYIIGKNCTVSEKEFIANINILEKSILKDDILIVYFSGHAQMINNSHYLCLSDSILETNQFIDYISRIKCKAKVIIIDACHCQIKKSYNCSTNPLEHITNNIGKGTLIVTATTPEQKSYFIPKLKVSTFTYFLCSALTNNHLLHNEKKSIYDILYTAIMHTDLYNRHHLNTSQSPQLYSNIWGDILFDAQKSNASQKTFYRKSFKKYLIYSIEPLHNIEFKRYCIKAILKAPISYDELKKISQQIVSRTKKINIFKNNIQKQRWNNKTANIIYIYFYISNNDADNCHHICQLSWFDNIDNLYQYVQLHNINCINKQYCFQINNNYSLFKALNLSHNISNEEYWEYLHQSLLEVIRIGDSIANYYHLLINKSISTDKYLQELSIYSNKIKSLYLKNSDIAPSHKFHEIDTLYSELLSVLYDLVCIADITTDYNNIVITSKNSIARYRKTLTNDKIRAFVNNSSINQLN